MKNADKEKTVIRPVPTALVTMDDNLRVRAKINNEAVEDYAEAMKNRSAFPPIVVYRDSDGRLCLVHGWHRVEAAKRANVTTINAVLLSGTYSDALRYALSANAENGQRLTSRDKHRCVELALSEFSNLSDRRIATMCRVSHTLVAAVRGELAENASSAADSGGGGASKKDDQHRRGMDGKTRRVPKRGHKELKSASAVTNQPVTPAAPGPGAEGTQLHSTSASGATTPAAAPAHPAVNPGLLAAFRKRRDQTKNPEPVLIARGLEQAYGACGKDTALAARVEALWVEIEPRVQAEPEEDAPSQTNSKEAA